MTDPTKETLGLDEAAAYLRLGRDATRALWDAGALPGVSLNQKHLVFRRAALAGSSYTYCVVLSSAGASSTITPSRTNTPSPTPQVAPGSGRARMVAPSAVAMV